jgi:hypothetical protein
MMRNRAVRPLSDSFTLMEWLYKHSSTLLRIDDRGTPPNVRLSDIDFLTCSYYIYL